MNKSSILRVLSTIAQNPSTFALSKESPAIFPNTLMVAIGKVDSGKQIVLNMGSREKIRAEFGEAKRYVHNLFFVPLAQYELPQVAATREFVKLFEENEINFLELQAYFKDSSFRQTFIELQIQPDQDQVQSSESMQSSGRVQHPVVELLKQMGVINESRHFSGCDDSTTCRTADNDSSVVINWDKPLFNAFGEVKYNRRENDTEKDYRQIKVVADGHTMNYPVNGETGRPLFQGMDMEAYAVFNKPEEAKAGSGEDLLENDDINSLMAHSMLNELFPEKSAEISKLLKSLTAA